MRARFPSKVVIFEYTCRAPFVRRNCFFSRSCGSSLCVELVHELKVASLELQEGDSRTCFVLESCDLPSGAVAIFAYFFRISRAESRGHSATSAYVFTCVLS